jgi:nitroimidazol reductase NimA-like FMN-containing flavoprotein (pyridoxamine 5'-phosphate oxidase superfamily)
MTEEDVVAEMSDEETWEMLREQELGRLAFRMVDETHITPVNYAVDTSTGSPTLLFRTAPGDKLLGVALGGEVAFEVDEIVGDTASSVVVRGHARQLEEDEAHRAENVPLRPWVGTPKYEVVEITPTEATGRRFHLSRPWRHMRTDVW